MRSEASKTEVAEVRNAITQVEQDLADLEQQRRQAEADRTDYESATALAARRAPGYDPRSRADAQSFAVDQAGLLLWEGYRRNEPHRTERLQRKLEVSLRDLVAKLANVVDYFEQDFCSEQALLPNISTASAEAVAGNVIATARQVLARRLPKHMPVIPAVAPDENWKSRTYAALLRGSKAERVA
jgi:hypothetical protein